MTIAGTIDMKALTAVALLLSTCSAAPVMAQVDDNCGPREKVVEGLLFNYDEVPVVMGVAGNELLEVFANQDTGSFTTTVSSAEGQTCLIASGVGFSWIPVQEGDPT